MSHTPLSILQANPHASYLAYQPEIDEAIHRVLNSGRYILGKEVSAFEEAFAVFIGVPYAIGVGNGRKGNSVPSGRCAIASTPRTGRFSFRATAMGHWSCGSSWPSGV